VTLGSFFDLASDARGKLSSDHSATFTALGGNTFSHASSAAHRTPYVIHLEIGYAVHELAFALLFLVVAAIPLRRGDRWAWWCSWLMALALLVLRPTAAAGS
jgi:hypothetical protein